MHLARRYLLCVGACLALTVPAHAACQLTNGTFDTNITGWSGGASAFNGAVGNPAGSAEVGPLVSANICQGFVQCIPMAAGDVCSLSAEVFIPVGQPSNGNETIQYTYFSDPLCATAIGFSPIPSVPGSIQGTWQGINLPATVAPPGTQSAQIVLNLCTGATGGLTGNWDNVVSRAPAVVSVPTLGGVGLGALALALAGCAFIVTRVTRR